MIDWDAPLDWLQRHAFWAKGGHAGWIIMIWFRDEAKEFFKREVKIMWSWIKRLIVGKLEDEAQTEISYILKAEIAKAQTVDTDAVAKKIIDKLNTMLGLSKEA